MKSFSERQNFDQWWLRILMLVSIGVIVGVIFNDNSANKIDSEDVFIGIGFGVLGIVIMLIITLYVHLDTKIDEQGIHYAFWPFHLGMKLIAWKDMNQCYVREYRPIAEYGGWGYRFRLFSKTRHALNVKGNIGIQIVLKDGKKLLLGTQKKQEVTSVIQTYSHKIKNL